MNEQLFPADSGMCTILNFNDSGILSDYGSNQDIYRAAKKFSSIGNYAITATPQKIKGTGARRGMLLQIMGPRHRQTFSEGSFFRHFMVSMEAVQ